MNIEDLTLKQIKEISGAMNLFNTNSDKQSQCLSLGNEIIKVIKE